MRDANRGNIIATSIAVVVLGFVLAVTAQKQTVSPPPPNESSSNSSTLNELAKIKARLEKLMPQERTPVPAVPNDKPVATSGSDALQKSTEFYLIQVLDELIDVERRWPGHVSENVADEFNVCLRLLDRHSTLKRNTKALQGSVTNSVGMALIPVSAGTFTMGSDEEEIERGEDEVAHEVTVTRSFLIGRTEVSQSQYISVMGMNPVLRYYAERAMPSKKAAPGFEESLDMKLRDKRILAADAPVSCVSWEDAAEFCRRLSELAAEKASGRKYRLLSEAEWEYCCRSGTKTRFAFGDSLAPRARVTTVVLNPDPEALASKTKANRTVPQNSPEVRTITGKRITTVPTPTIKPLPPQHAITERDFPRLSSEEFAIGVYANFGRPADGGSETEYNAQASTTASFYANDWGLHDMHGNVAEWCADWYGQYLINKAVDPSGPTMGEKRVIRGGSFCDKEDGCRSARRGCDLPTKKSVTVGFRVVCETESN